MLEEESERTSPSKMRRRRSSSTFGSMMSSVRSSQPCFVLNCANARRPCSLRAIYREEKRWFSPVLCLVKVFGSPTLLTSTRLSTLSATASGCCFKGDDMFFAWVRVHPQKNARLPMGRTRMVIKNIEKKNCRELV